MSSNRRNLRNRNTSASGTPSNSRASELEAGPLVINDPQLDSVGQNQTEERQMARETESVSVPLVETTSENQSRRRIRWTIQMNECVVREYLRVTRNQTVMINYRQALHRNFVHAYPNLSYLTEQNIADRRSAIYRRNLVTELRRAEISNEIASSSPSSNEQPETNVMLDLEPEPPVTITEVLPNVQNPQDLLSNTIKNEYQSAVSLYSGMASSSRPKIPKQNISPKFLHLVKLANETVLPSVVDTIAEFTELDTVIYCMAIATVKLNGGKILTMQQPSRKSRKTATPIWMKRLENKIAAIRKEIGILTAFINGNSSKRMKNKVATIKSKNKIHAEHNPINLTVPEVLDTLKQRLSVYAQRLRRYTKSFNRKNDNVCFGADQKQFFRKLRSSHRDEENATPEKDELERFWSNIWAKEACFNPQAIWLEQIKRTTEPFTTMRVEDISAENLRKVLMNLQNWKSPGPDQIHNFWYKKFDTLWEKMRHFFNTFLHNPDRIPPYICEGKTVLISKGVNSYDPANYRPITCLNTSYKILTGCILAIIREHCENNNILAEEQKGCCRGSLGCKEQLVIDNIIMSQAVKTNRNVYTSFIDYKKAYDMVPHDWLLKVLELYKINPVIINTLGAVMDKWRTKLFLNLKNKTITTGIIPIKRGIFQGDTLSPYWFCLAMNPLATLLNTTNKGFELKHGRSDKVRISHLAYMDDIKLYAATKDGLHILLHTTEQFSSDIKMEFGVDKCRMQAITKGRIVGQTPFLTSTNQLITAMSADEVYKYLGIEQGTVINHTSTKLKIQDHFIERLKSVLKTSLNARNLVTAINTFAVPIIIFTFGILRWSDTDIANIERAIRVQMTRYRIHHPKSAIERTTIARKDGGRGIISFAQQHAKIINDMRNYFYLKANTSQLYKVIALSDINYTPLNLSHVDLNLPQHTSLNKIEQWKQKALHGRYPAEILSNTVDKGWSLKWLTVGYLFPETEGFIIAIQDQVIKTKNYRKYVIKDETVVDDNCRICGQCQETIQHITGGCSSLAPADYKIRHDRVGSEVHRALAMKYELIEPNGTASYTYQPLTVLENGNSVLYWDRSILTDRSVSHNRPDLTLWRKDDSKVWLIDIAIVNTNNLETTYRTKMQKYEQLAELIKEQWRVKSVEIIPIILSTTGVVPKTLLMSLEKLQLELKLIIKMQKTVILNTCRTVRKVIGENM